MGQKEERRGEKGGIKAGKKREEWTKSRGDKVRSEKQNRRRTGRMKR